MKTKFSKVMAFLMMLVMVISVSVVSGAAEDVEYLAAENINVNIESEADGEAKVTLVSKIPFTYYGIEGTWSIKEETDTSYLDLTGIALSGVTINGTYDKLDPETGEVVWVDDTDGAMNGVTFSAAGETLMTATYKVANDTPAGTYKVKFVMDVISIGTDDPVEETVEFEAVINVTHTCKLVPANDGKAPSCTEDGYADHFVCTHNGCAKIYADAAGKNEITNLEEWRANEGKLGATDHAWGEPTSYTNNNDGTHTANYVCGNNAQHTKSGDPVAHDFTNGDCVCGEPKPAVGGLKGDVNLDGVVDSDDITKLARHVYGIEIITNETALINSDVKDDDVVDSDDITKLARYVYGIIQNWDQE